ncbi:hypothetical protein [Thiolapillus sp.]
MPDPIFQSEKHYRAAFVAGLELLLHTNQLGIFVLVLANSIYDPQIHAILGGKLKQRFAILSQQVRNQLIQGRSLEYADDDVPVFLKLMAIGLENLQDTLFRRAGPWEVQFNHLRAFRPARMSNMLITSLQAPFNTDDFHFNKDFLRQEIIWEGELLGDHCRLLYNKFPFAPLHGLLVLEPEKNHPQYLGRDTHEHYWQLLELLGKTLPDCGFGYNARGACSSINHLHVQMYAGKTGGYPIEQPQWRHNGGGQDYPLQVECFGSAMESWRHIERLHQRNHAYNLLYRPGKIYVIQRTMQGSYKQKNGLGSFAWAEACGSMTTFNRTAFSQLGADEITMELALLRL